MITMDIRLKFLLILFCLSLTGCTSQPVKESDTANNTITESHEDPTQSKYPPQMTGINPPMTITKGKKKLNLMRILDGGICKNDLQGAKGTFLLYADSSDIDRIKKEKGSAIFKTFETKIQEISSTILQTAIDNTNLGEDPFALGPDEAQQKLASQLMLNFADAASESINKFQKETSLTIDITAFKPSLVFFQKGCDESKLDEETKDSEG